MRSTGTRLFLPMVGIVGEVVDEVDSGLLGQRDADRTGRRLPEAYFATLTQATGL